MDTNTKTISCQHNGDLAQGSRRRSVSPNRPLVLQDFTVIQRHEGRGIAIVAWNNLSKTVSLDKWSTTSRKWQGIRTEQPDERHKSLMHTSTLPPASQGRVGISWGDGRRAGRHNYDMRWFQCTVNQQGCSLEAALNDVLFTLVPTASPTHPGTRHGDTDSTGT